MTTEEIKELFEKYELSQIADIVDDFFGGGGPSVDIDDMNVLMNKAFPPDDPDEAPLTVEELRDLQRTTGRITGFLSRLYEFTSNCTYVKSKYGCKAETRN